MKFNTYLLEAAVTAASVHGAGTAPYPREATPPAAQDADRGDAVTDSKVRPLRAPPKIDRPNYRVVLITAAALACVRLLAARPLRH